jgi:hypothetical protein
MSKRISILLVTSAICASCARTETWNSRLFPKVDGKFTIRSISFAGREWTLDDFSYVGYRLGVEFGQRPVPEVGAH